MPLNNKSYYDNNCRTITVEYNDSQEKHSKEKMIRADREELNK